MIKTKQNFLFENINNRLTFIRCYDKQRHRAIVKTIINNSFTLLLYAVKTSWTRYMQ